MRIKFEHLCFILTIVLVHINDLIMAKTESSAEYLEKVMFELRELNAPSTFRRIPNTRYALQNLEKQGKQYGQLHHNSDFKNMEMSLKKLDMQSSPSENVPQYYKDHLVLPTRSTTAVAAHKNVLQKGTAISLTSLTNTLSQEKKLPIVETHVELPAQQPMYNYYFFPLNPVEAEVQNYPYKPTDHHALESNANGTQTQLRNPLFVAISTFLSMALVFMMGVIFLPKLHQFTIFSSRRRDDDYFYVENALMKALRKFTNGNAYFGR